MARGSGGRHGAADGGRRQRLEELFLLATELTSAERVGFFDRHCADDPSLRAELEELLVQDDEGTKGVLAGRALFPELPGHADAGTDDAGDLGGDERGLPARVGRYRLIEKIGDGGMGSVWIAEQEEPVRRRVALKFLHRIDGPSTGETLAGFEAERQALALMDHPGIARIFDAGTTERRPWFAMEYAPGVPIDELCEREGYGLRRRLALFLRVSEAVQHAHQKGVVHRDIKPRNVLVALEGAQPVPKLIDFGIARAVGQLSAGAGPDASPAGSYNYMAPEQAAGDMDVDTRADVYSLGALLYVLVARKPPFDADAFRGMGLDQVARFLRENPPPPPSERSGDAALARELRGDLDRIALHALARDRDQRYGAVSELALDVRRYLASEPISVGPGSVVYRARKSLVRNRGLFASAAGIALALVLGVIGTTRAMLEAGRQRDAAVKAQRAEAEQSSIARAEAAQSREITSFLVETLSLADPTVALRSDLPVRALLDGAGERVGDVFADHPASEAVVRRAIGVAYASLGLFERAEHHLQRALSIQESDAKTPTREVYQTAWALVLLYEDSNARKGMNLELRASHLRTDMVEARHPALGRELRRLDDFVTGFQIDEATLALDDVRREYATLERGDPAWPLAAETIGNAGRLIGSFRSPEQAVPFIEESLALLRRESSSTHPDVARHTRWLVALLLADAQYQRAEELLSQTLKNYRGSLPDDHWLVADARSRLGECLSEQGRLDEALPLLEQSHDALDRVLGSGSRATLVAGRRRVEALERAGRTDDANATREKLGASLAFTEAFPRRWREARTAFADSRASLRDALDSLDDAIAAAGAGPSSEKQRALAGAVRAAIEQRTALADDDALSIVVARQFLEWGVDLRAEDPRIRGPLYLDALRVLEPLRGDLPGPVGQALLGLGWVAQADGQFSEAEQLAIDATGLFYDAFGKSSMSSWWATTLHGEALAAQGRFEEAEQVLVAMRDTACSVTPEFCERLDAALRRLYASWDLARGAER
jgi:tetratricopeptide (TPR) repeat protein